MLEAQPLLEPLPAPIHFIDFARPPPTGVDPAAAARKLAEAIAHGERGESRREGNVVGPDVAEGVADAALYAAAQMTPLLVSYGVE